MDCFLCVCNALCLELVLNCDFETNYSLEKLYSYEDSLVLLVTDLHGGERKEYFNFNFIKLKMLIITT